MHNRAINQTKWLEDAEALCERLKRQERNLARGKELGWTEPSGETFSGRMAGRNPQGIIDVWPDFENPDPDFRARGFQAVK